MSAHKHFIQQLKQKPRHGASPNMPSLNDLITALGEVGSEALGALTGLADALLRLNETNANTVRGLEKQIAANDVLIQQYMNVANKSLYLERRNKNLNTSFGINSKSAAALASSLQRQGNQLGITGEQMMKYSTSIRKLIPGINQANLETNKQYKGLVRVQQVLTTNLGLTEQQAEDYSYFASQRGKDAESQLASQYSLSKEIERSTGEIGVFKTISEGIAATTADLQLQYGRIPGNLELAILKANKLGFSMQDLALAANNLLNIESSIGDELEYQLLSGRRLVGNDQARADLQGKSLTNAYREAALQGDANKQADVLNTILEQEGKTLESNLFARQQMSKLLGMDEAALARALQKKSILESIGGDTLFEKSGDALLDAAKAMGASEDVLKELTEIEDTRTTDDILKQILTVLQEGRGGAKAVLETQTDVVAGVQKVVLKDTKDAFEKMLFDMDKSRLPIVGAGLLGKDEVAAFDGIVDKLVAAETKTIEPAQQGQDLVSLPGSNGRVLTGEFGAFSLDDRDLIMAGDPKKMLGDGGNNSAAGFMAAASLIVAAIQAQTSQLKQDSTFGNGLTGRRM
jgi:hypothetical protein